MHDAGDTINCDALPWLPLAPRVSIRIIKVTPETGAYSVMIKADAGGVLPRHKHLDRAEIFILKGAGVHPQTGAYQKGDYVSERAGAMHDALEFQEDTELLMVSNGPSAFVDDGDNVRFMMDVDMLQSLAASQGQVVRVS